MIAHASQLRSSAVRRSIAQVRYEAPADLLPWADPYIASLFADEESQSEIDTVVLDESEEDDLVWFRR